MDIWAFGFYIIIEVNWEGRYDWINYNKFLVKSKYYFSMEVLNVLLGGMVF